MSEISTTIARCRDRIARSKAKLGSIGGDLLDMMAMPHLLQMIDESYAELQLDRLLKDDVTPEQEEKIKQTLSAVEQMLDFLDSVAEMLAKMSGMLTSLAQSYQ